MTLGPQAAEDEEMEFELRVFKVEDVEGKERHAKTVDSPTLQDDDNDSDATSSHAGKGEWKEARGQERQLFALLKGLKEDLATRGPYYKSDWDRPQNIVTVINASVFAFVIQLIPALIFADLMDRKTNGNMATAETLLSNGISGAIYAICSGQPLTLMGITGPVVLLLGTSYGLTETFQAEYFPFLFWVCIWAGLMHMISAMIGLVNLVWQVTPFTGQIFEFFIAVTFIFVAVRDLLEPIHLGQDDYQDDRSAQYASLMLGMITCHVAWSLHFADQWVILPRQVRIFLNSYNTLIAVVIATALSFLPGVDLAKDGGGGLIRVNVRAPWDWQPTVDRPWLTNPLSGIDAQGILGAMIPGFIFFLLFFIDHNVSSILTQSPKFHLKKPPAYHWDFFVLGVTFIPCAIMGLPPGNGLIPQAPLHARALCTRMYVTDSHSVRHEVVTHCEEQRYSGLAQALLMFVALASFTVISWIPRGCLLGLFLYLGIATLHGNEVWERIVMSFTMPKNRPDIPMIREVEWRTVQTYTLLQAACGMLIFLVAEFASFGYVYPALLAALVPLRSFLINKIFSQQDLQHLDPSLGTKQEQEEEEPRVTRVQENNPLDPQDQIPQFSGQCHADTIKKRHHDLKRGLTKCSSSLESCHDA